MKKIFLMLAIVAFSFTAVSCGDDKAKETKKEITHNHEDAYQCPMDCENGKTYEKPGTCPVCKMDLKKVEHKH